MGAISTLRLPDHRPTAEINITPLIDVMLALLLIFMLAAPMLTKEIPLPQGAKNSATPQPRILELGINAQGLATRNGYTLSPLELQAEVAAFASKGGDMSLQLRPDAAASHESVVGVLALARNSDIKAIALETPQR